MPVFDNIFRSVDSSSSSTCEGLDCCGGRVVDFLQADEAMYLLRIEQHLAGGLKIRLLRLLPSRHFIDQKVDLAEMSYFLLLCVYIYICTKHQVPGMIHR